MEEQQPTEACGRCSMTTVVDAVDANSDEGMADPFDGERIEVEESDVRRVSPVAWMQNATARLNAAVQRLTYGQ
ncbi:MULTISPECIES: hypothetical protein [Halobacterium]|uniref:hypothetical protein n=1 Tax=Halobacterium TaxID=2239 RepID=UPI00073E3933|nr:MULTISPECIES: hypothetical protein [Halobacterium]MCG1002771.1 hypothetical protein [Halobacterium noricense]